MKMFKKVLVSLLLVLMCTGSAHGAGDEMLDLDKFLQEPKVNNMPNPATMNYFLENQAKQATQVAPPVAGNRRTELARISKVDYDAKLGRYQFALTTLTTKEDFIVIPNIPQQAKHEIVFKALSSMFNERMVKIIIDDVGTVDIWDDYIYEMKY